jgi:predicted Fe-S protein YdhL (DUF1289 family)
MQARTMMEASDGYTKDVAGGLRSPCVGVCELDIETDRCLGCLRTLAEIAAWPTLGDAEKQRLLDRLNLRRHGHAADGT